MSYTFILKQEPDDGFVAIVPALPGCVTQGDTREQVITNIQDAIQLYTEDCVALGDPVPAEVGKQFMEAPAESPKTRAIIL